MVNLSIREAVKHYQVSRPTLTKALKLGKISGTQDGRGKWSIDPSEMARVYRPRQIIPNDYDPTQLDKISENLVVPSATDQSQLKILHAQLAEIELRAEKAEARANAAELLAKERAERIEDLRRMLPVQDQPKKRHWWWRSPSN